MALPNVNIKIQNGGLNRTGLNEDIVSGLLFYNEQWDGLSASTYVTTGTTYSGVCFNVKSIEEAELAGILSTGNYTVEHFQIDQYFKGNKNGDLYVMIAEPAALSAYTFEEVKYLQIFAEGKIRRVGVSMLDIALATTDVDALQDIADDLYDDEMPLTIYYAPDTSSIAYTALPDLRALTNTSVSVVIGQSNSGTAASLAAAKGFSVTPLGLILGYKSTDVSENVGNVSLFNMKVGTENDTLKICNLLYKDIPTSALTTINDKGYIFMLKQTGIAGTYINDMPTAAPATSDYAFQMENEVIFKAIRGVRQYLKPTLNKKVKVNADGTLYYPEVQNFQNIASTPLEAMLKNDEISAFVVYVDPTVNIVSTSELKVSIGIVPVGYNRYINVTIGLKSSL